MIFKIHRLLAAIGWKPKVSTDAREMQNYTEVGVFSSSNVSCKSENPYYPLET